MSLSVLYIIIMWGWVVGAELWVLTAVRRNEPRLLWVAGVYTLVALMNGVTALAYQASGR